MTKSRRSRSQIPQKSKPLVKTVPQQQSKEEDQADLQIMQDRMKRQPELYRKEFLKQFNHFKEKLNEFKTNPAKKDDRLEEYFKFFSHQYYSILNPAMRLAMVTSLKIMRGKDVIAAQVVLPVFFKLFKCKDKELRKFLHSFIISDLKKINIAHKNHGINRKLQNFIFEMLKDQNEASSKRSLSVMIELYKRKIWNDDKTINVIAEGCLHDNPKIVAAACKFFLTLNYSMESDLESESSDEDDKKMVLKMRTGSKVTKHKEARMERAIKQHKRKERRRNKVKYSTDFLPIDLIYDPQNFSEKLFTKLRKTNDRYEVKLLMMRLISRMIGRHQLIILQFYPHLIRYLGTHQKDKIAEIFAMIIESCHELVPPEEVKPLIEKIISNFITEYCENQHITVGINTIREILNRMPLALEESQIEYLVQFRHFRNASVVNAAKSLVNYFRDVCPHLLPKKFRGRFTKQDEDNKIENMVYGKQKINYDIDGIELLRKAENLPEGTNIATERILDENDLRKIKILKLKQAVKDIDKNGFKDEKEEDQEEEEEEISDLYEEDFEELGSEEELDEENESEQELDENEDSEQELEEEEDEVQVDESDEEDIEEDEELQEEEQDSDKEDKQDDLDISSSELEESEEDNPHGFVFAHQLDTYKKSKRERLEIQKAEFDKDAHREKYKKKRDKKGGKTNKQNLKNKPFMMVRHKKIDSIQEKFSSTKKNIKRLQKQLGKFKKNQKSKIEAKKKRAKQGRR